MTANLNWHQIFRFLGILLLTEALFLCIPTLISYGYGENDLSAFVRTVIFTAVTGLSFHMLGTSARLSHIGTREGYLIVSFVWILFSFFGMMPFLFSGYISSVTDAYFETMSGFTTTGATVVRDIESLPHGLLFWRSLTQWLGGMGIVVLSLAILPMLSGGMQLFVAETPGVTYSKIQPHIKDTARNLWGMYAVFTLLATVLLAMAGMGWFDAVCHAFTTLSSGGYSTKSASIGHWSSPAIHYIIILFMIVAGTNFALIFRSLRNLRPLTLARDEECRTYHITIWVYTLIIFVGLLITRHADSFSAVEGSFRAALFQVVSVLTTTGFASEDYMQWHPILWLILMLIMSIGASAGSTASGIKILRMNIIAKNLLLEFDRIIHPRAIMPVRINGHRIHDNVISNIYVFLTIFVMLVIISVIIFMLCGLPPHEAFGCTVTAIANVGPGVGSQGPAGTFADLLPFAKWYMSFLMLIGRLELFTILVLFVPSFWRKQ